MIYILAIIGFVLLIWVFNRIDKATEKYKDRLYEINKEMYYEQADRDGCDYPPQFKGF